MFLFYPFFIKTYQPIFYLYFKSYIFCSNKFYFTNNQSITNFTCYLFFPLKFINNTSTSWAWFCFPLRCNHFMVCFR